MALLCKRVEADYTPHKLLRTQTTLMTLRFCQIHHQAESMLYSLERVRCGIGVHVNTNKTEFNYFNQRDGIFTLNCGFLKLVDKFTYLGSSISSTKHGINTWCNGYRRRKWTRRHKFKSWTRLIAFHIALIPLRKVRIQLFSLKLWVNSRPD